MAINNNLIQQLNVHLCFVDTIDEAVLRPGRLDKTLYVGPPSEKDRLLILEAITKVSRMVTGLKCKSCLHKMYTKQRDQKRECFPLFCHRMEPNLQWEKTSPWKL